MRKTVPSDRLLVFRVQDGWKPLADHLGVPVVSRRKKLLPQDFYKFYFSQPTRPFPNVNDSAQINMIAFTVRVAAWIVIVLLPLLLLGTVGKK